MVAGEGEGESESERTRLLPGVASSVNSPDINSSNQHQPTHSMQTQPPKFYSTYQQEEESQQTQYQQSRISSQRGHRQHHQQSNGLSSSSDTDSFYSTRQILSSTATTDASDSIYNAAGRSPSPLILTSLPTNGSWPSNNDDSLLCRVERSLDSFFSIRQRGSSVTAEVRAGAVTFVTMAYILVVNAQILSKSGPDHHGRWMDFDSIVAATALSAAIGSALVGLIGNLPFGLAPGMGLNSYFTYGICLRLGLNWHVALTTCFVQGVLFMALALIGACDLIQLYAPPCIKKSITVGLGLFQALIGFELMRLVIPGSPGDTLLSIGDMTDLKIYLSLGGMMLICILLVWKIKAAMLVGIMFITAAAWSLQLTPPPRSVFSMPSLEDPLHTLDFVGFFKHLHSTLPVTLVMLFVAVFDTAGVQYMCGSEADLLDPETDTLPGAKGAFFSAGFSTAIGAMLGTSPVIIHNETVAGISDGARTGLHSVTVALLFILSIPFAPVLRAVPPIATAAPLVIVGMCMMMTCRFIDWESTHEAMPAFLCATVLPLTYSIANGMVIGIVAYAILKSSHKLGEHFMPDRFKRDGTLTPPPARCTAPLKCGCPKCLQEQMTLMMMETNGRVATFRGETTPQRDESFLLSPTPRKKQQEFFEDPVPGAPTFPFISSPNRAPRRASSAASHTSRSVDHTPAFPLPLPTVMPITTPTHTSVDADLQAQWKRTNGEHVSHHHQRHTPTGLDQPSRSPYLHPHSHPHPHSLTRAHDAGVLHYEGPALGPNGGGGSGEAHYQQMDGRTEPMN